MGTLAGGNNRQIQKQGARRNGWTKERRASFIEELTATCNVKAACRKVGMHWGSVYNLRRRDAAFSRLWEEALATGYVRLEAELLARALGETSDPDNPTEVPEAVDRPAIAFDPALGARLLAQRYAVERGRRAGPDEYRQGSAEETDAALLRKLAALRRRREREQ